MPEDVDTLETKRSKLLQEFLSLGDLRPGSLTAVMRRCGKPSCHCAKRNDPGHDPQFPPHSPRGRQDRDGDLSQSHRPA